MSQKNDWKMDVINVRAAKGAERYQRDIHLPRLIPIPRHLIEAVDENQSQMIVTNLNCALRRERNLGKTGHWAYDLNRHFGLMQAYKCELELLNVKRNKRHR